jgi:hypothetical protein
MRATCSGSGGDEAPAMQNMKQKTHKLMRLKRRAGSSLCATPVDQNG